jgi:hypothetical protein
MRSPISIRAIPTLPAPPAPLPPVRPAVFFFATRRLAGLRAAVFFTTLRLAGLRAAVFFTTLRLAGLRAAVLFTTLRLAGLRAAVLFTTLRLTGLRAAVFLVATLNTPEVDDGRPLYQPPGGTSLDCTVDQARSSRHARKNAVGSVSNMFNHPGKVAGVGDSPRSGSLLPSAPGWSRPVPLGSAFAVPCLPSAPVACRRFRRSRLEIALEARVQRVAVFVALK